MAVAEFEVSIDIDTKGIISSIAKINEAFKTSLSKIDDAINQVTKGWKDFVSVAEKNIKQPEFNPPDIDKATKEFESNSKEMEKDINRVEKEWKDLEKEVEKPLEPSVDDKKIKNDFASISAAAGIAGANMTQMLTQPILDFGKNIVDVGQDYSKAMGMLAGVTDGTTATMDKLGKKAMEIGSNSLFSSTEAAKGMYYLASAGYNVDQVMASLEGTMRLATAGQLDLDRASEIVTGAMTAMGASADQTNMFVDVLAKTAAATNTNIGQMGNAFEYVAPLAGTLGYSIQEVSIALGLMANNGIKGEKAGTAMRGALSKLLKPTDDGAALMQKLGIKMADSSGKAISLTDLIISLRNSFANLSQEEQTNAAITLFGQEAMNGMLAIINTATMDYENLAIGIDNADGVAKGMSDTMEKTSPVDKMKASLETMYASISTNLSPIITTLAEALGSLVTWFGKLDPAIQGGILAFAGLIALLAPLLSILGTIGIIIQASTNAAMVSLMVTVGWVVLAIAALIVIGVLVWKYWKNIMQWFKNVGKWFADIWNAVGKFFIDTWNSIGKFFMDVWNVIVNLFMAYVNYIINTGKKILDFFIALPGMILQFFMKLPYWIGYVIGLIIGYIAKFFLMIWNYYTVILPQIIMGIIKWFYELPGKIWKALLETGAKISAWFVNIWNIASVEIPKLINSIGLWFYQLPGKIWAVILDIMAKVSAWFINMGNAAKTEITKLIRNIVQWFANLPQNMLEIGKNLVKGLWDGIVNMGKWIMNKISEFCKGVTQGFKQGFGISSPSKVTTKFGEYLAEGLGVGFNDQIANVFGGMEKAIKLGNSQLDSTIQMGMMETSADITNSSQNLGMIAMNESINNKTPNTYSNNVTINVKSPAEAVKEIRVLNKQMALGW